MLYFIKLEVIMSRNNYVIKSLEVHLFFARIMKEHSLFLKAGFTPANQAFANKAEFFMKEFDKLLCQAVAIANSAVRNEVLCSQEVVTDFTALAEKQTERFTGIHINKELTLRELRLNGIDCNCEINLENKCSIVRRINQSALRLIDGLIAFKEGVLKNVLQCQMFTQSYPLLIEHIIREARQYRCHINILEKDGDLCDESVKEAEAFWNQIMMEHAMFIRGLLDPCETELFNSADSFAKEYAQLINTSCNSHNKAIASATEINRNLHSKNIQSEANRNMYGRAFMPEADTNKAPHSKPTMPDSLELTIKFQGFKQASVQGIQQCKIRSIILPLLADHVLREANHYIRILKC